MKKFVRPGFGGQNTHLNYPSSLPLTHQPSATNSVASRTVALEELLAGLGGAGLLDRGQPNNNHKNP